MLATNGVPDIIYYKYDWLVRFSHMNWLYFNQSSQSMKPISEIIIKPEERDIRESYKEAVMSMDRSVYIFNIDMARHAIEKIVFFYTLGFLTQYDVANIIHEYMLLLDEMEDISISGILSENGKEVDMFYSDILLTGDITIVDSDNIKFAALDAFFVNPIITRSTESFNMIKGWFHSLLRTANIISMTGSSKRKKFFARQKQELQNLSIA